MLRSTTIWASWKPACGFGYLQLAQDQFIFLEYI